MNAAAEKKRPAGTGQNCVTSNSSLPRPHANLQPPSLPETEQAIIGCCLMHPKAYATAAGMITEPDIFNEDIHRALWRILQGWYRVYPGTPPDGAAMTAMLEAAELPIDLASECAACACLPANLEYHAGRLLACWAMRTVRDSAATLARCCDARDTAGMMKVLRGIGRTVRKARLTGEGKS